MAQSHACIAMDASQTSVHWNKPNTCNHIHAPTRITNLQNLQAWVFAALEDEERARMYYWFAALYAIPLLHSGLKVDSFTIAMLLTGVAHIQVRLLQAAFGVSG